jgi:hypothetical protein
MLPSEKINETKQNSSNADIPVRINTGEPIWINDIVRQAVNIVYFLKSMPIVTIKD